MPFNQRLDLAPSAASWQGATPADRLAYFREAGARAVAEKRAELARAIGSNGRRMKARKHPRPDGADGPVLTPHDASSRTARLMACKATAAGVTLFWHSGKGKRQRKAWGTILGFHAAGQVRGAPVRDVRLSRRGAGRVRASMADWWARRVRARRREEDEAERAEQARLTERSRYLRRYFRDPGRGF